MGDIAVCYFDHKWSRLGKNTHIDLKKTTMKKKNTISLKNCPLTKMLCE